MLDVSALNMTRFDLQTRAGQTRVRLPEAPARTTVAAHGGVTDLMFEVPNGVAADIAILDGPASRQMDERGFRASPAGTIRSPDYDTAVSRADMQIELGIASLTIR